jgi:diguanylate cyclase (GGDEF)-like protein
MHVGGGPTELPDPSRYDALLRTSQEMSLHALELDAAAARDQATLIRHAFLGQRAARFCGVGILTLVVVWLAGWSLTVAAIALGVTAVYAAVVWQTGRIIVSEYSLEGSRGAALTTLLICDVLALGGLVLLGGSAALPLMPVVLVVLAAVAAFQFGGRRGTIIAGVGAGAYLAVAVTQRLVLHAAQPTWPAIFIAFAASILASVSAIRVLGGYRRRLDTLRLYCKLGELGDASVAIPIDAKRAPDDLTLLAASFDAMRNRLGDQIGSDPLTGCANRRTLERRLLADWRLAKRRNASVAVTAVDIDHFKQINDTRGHPVGDLVLQQIASIMIETARETDTVARLGGDEFVIILPDTDAAGAVIFAERLRERVTEFTFGPVGDPLSITISAGVAVRSGTAPIDPEALLGDADRCLYRAKQDGRNRVRI